MDEEEKNSWNVRVKVQTSTPVRRFGGIWRELWKNNQHSDLKQCCEEHWAGLQKKVLHVTEGHTHSHPGLHFPACPCTSPTPSYHSCTSFDFAAALNGLFFYTQSLWSVLITSCQAVILCFTSLVFDLDLACPTLFLIAAVMNLKKRPHKGKC